MTALKLRLRGLGYLAVHIVPVFIFFPWWLQHAYSGGFSWNGNGWQWLGVVLIVTGIGLIGWTFELLSVKGRGSPYPWDPPIQFVIRGPYRHLRHPMVVGLLTLLWGQTALYESTVVFAFSVVVTVLNVLYVQVLEEPESKRRFGQAYLAYIERVPGWLPRLRSYDEEVEQIASKAGR